MPKVCEWPAVCSNNLFQNPWGKNDHIATQHNTKESKRNHYRLQSSASSSQGVMAKWSQPLSGTLGPEKGCGFKTHWCADGSLPLSLTWGVSSIDGLSSPGMVLCFKNKINLEKKNSNFRTLNPKFWRSPTLKPRTLNSS